MALLSVRGLNVRVGDTLAVAGIDFDVAAGELLAIVGESGAGKTQACLAPFGLGGGQVTGSVSFDGRKLVGLPETTLRPLREGAVAFILQAPRSTLAPRRSIGRQLAARGLSAAEATRSLQSVGLSDPQLRQRPHELSAGARQRVAIALALANRPKLLIADEPTAGLDAVAAREVLDLLGRLRRERGVGLVLVSRDLALVRDHADRVLVLRRGRAVEWGPAARVLGRPRGRYTRALIAATPRLDTPVEARPPIGPPLVEARGVTVDVRVPDGRFSRAARRVVDNVSLVVREGEALGIIGASGAGKSALAQAIAGAGPMSAGELRWRGTPRRIAFQPPVDALDPDRWIADAIAAPLASRPDIPRDRHARLVIDTMRAVGLDPRRWDRRPSQLSGGEAQRATLAGALIAEPGLLVCDGGIDALDARSQAELVALLQHWQRIYGLSLLFVSHDIALVRQLCHRVMVLDGGRLAEEGPTEAVLGIPRSDAARRLVAAAQ